MKKFLLFAEETTGPAPTGNFLLLEDSSFLLLEDGFKLLLEM